jgi:hypothetical protein
VLIHKFAVLATNGGLHVLETCPSQFVEWNKILAIHASEGLPEDLMLHLLLYPFFGLREHLSSFRTSCGKTTLGSYSGKYLASKLRPCVSSASKSMKISCGMHSNVQVIPKPPSKHLNSFLGRELVIRPLTCSFSCLAYLVAYPYIRKTYAETRNPLNA